MTKKEQPKKKPLGIRAFRKLQKQKELEQAALMLGGYEAIERDRQLMKEKKGSLEGLNGIRGCRSSHGEKGCGGSHRSIHLRREEGE